MAGQFALLAVLATVTGLGPAGWLTGSVCAVVTCVILRRALRTSGRLHLGAANQVTLGRAILVGAVAALAADSMMGRRSVVVLVTLASVALALDAADGIVARRTGTASALGARFDMEVDAFHILVLSVLVGHSFGWWVLTIGAMRYAFVAAARWLPWLRGPLRPLFSRKAVAAIQGIVLVVASAGVLPRAWTVAILGAALALLVWSFGRDIAGLWRAQRRRRHNQLNNRLNNQPGGLPNDQRDVLVPAIG